MFAGGFTLEAAEAVCASGDIASEAVLALLLRLVDRSLVLAQEREGGETRYRLLETLRQYGWERLVESNQASRLRDRHAAYYVALAEQAERHFQGPAQTTWLDRLDAEQGNLAAALEWGLPDSATRASGVAPLDADTGLRLAGALWWFWFQRGHWWAGQRWLERTLAGSRDAATPARAKALLGAGVASEFRGHHEQAIRLLEESVAMDRGAGAPRRLAYALSVLGFYTRGAEVGYDAGYQGDYDRGTALLEEGLALARLVDDPWLVMWLLLNLAYSTDVHRSEERARADGGRGPGVLGLRRRGEPAPPV